MQDASCSAYVASILVDRAQPLLRSLQRASKRAEKEMAEFGTLPGEGAPVPPSQDGEVAAEVGRASSLGKGREGSAGEVAIGNGDVPPPAKRPRTARAQVGWKRAYS